MEESWKERDGLFRFKEDLERYIFENIVDVLSYVDMDAVFRYVSPSHKRALGYEPADLLGKSIYTIIHPDDFHRVDAAIRESIITKKPKKSETRLKHAGGHYIWFETFGNPLLNEEGRVEGAVFNVRDISERKKMEEALKESEERYRGILSSLEEAYYEMDLRGNLLFFNDSLYRMLGYTREEMQDKNYNRMVKNLEEFFERLNRVYHTGEPEKGFEMILTGKGNREVAAEASASLLRDEQNKPWGFRGIIRDVTERKKVEQEMGYRKKHFETLFRNSTDAIFYGGLEEGVTVMDINDRFTEMFGYTLEDIRDTSFTSLLARGEKVKEAEKITRRLIRGESINMESVRYNKAGQPIEVEIKGVPVMIDGRFSGTYVIYSDITERKRYEKQLKYLSIFDSLTGVYNRTFFEEEMARLGDGREHPVSIMMVDLDDLKNVNDSLGHLTGDAVLKTCAGALKSSTRKKDVVARIGGDEFVLVLPGTSAKVAAKIRDRIYKTIRKTREEKPDMPLSVSIGISTTTQPGQPLGEVFKAADDEMYRNKVTRSTSSGWGGDL